MATKPGLLTHWPWEKLGNFKYVIVTPLVVHNLYKLATAKDWSEVDFSSLIIPSLLMRMLHSQIWISYSRFQTARSPHRILDRPIEFEQVDRERTWDDQIFFNGILFYVGYTLIPYAKHLPWWQTNGFFWMFVLHAGPVEFLYYWFHRALHHHFLYSRYHSHHHASIVTEPITSVIHPFAEHIVYYVLFAIPIVTTTLTGTASLMTIHLYIFYIDFMNNMGHCNFEVVPKWWFQVFPPLKYLMYTPSFHSLHHTQFRTNYSLFMPFYDYIYCTVGKSADALYETSLKGREDVPQVVHLTHPTTLQSIFHLRLGFASLASMPYCSKWYMALMWPMAWAPMLLTWICGTTFTVERNTLKKIKMQTWAIPRFSFQYGLTWQREAINDLIVKSILEAEDKGVQVLSLGLMNQAKDINESGKLYLQKYPKLKLKIVDGSSLAAAVVLKSVPQGTKQVLLRGKPSKVSQAVALELCKRGVQVVMTSRHEYHILLPQLSKCIVENLTLSSDYNPQIWLIGDGLEDVEQKKASKGTCFIPFSQIPPMKIRKDCVYHSTPAMNAPTTLENMHACENWLPRRVMSAWRVAGIIHALEGWESNECGETILDIEKSWSAALSHGFIPFTQV